MAIPLTEQNLKDEPARSTRQTREQNAPDTPRILWQKRFTNTYFSHMTDFLSAKCACYLRVRPAPHSQSMGAHLTFLLSSPKASSNLNTLVLVRDTAA